jgi:hypothetical protein
MPATLSTPSLLEVIALFERAYQLVTGNEGQPLRGVPGWDFYARTCLSRTETGEWMVCLGYANYYPASLGDDRVPVDIEEDEDADSYSYRCPGTFRKKHVAASEVSILAVPTAKFLDHLASLLNIPQALRGNFNDPAIQDVLWYLGKVRVADVQVPVWLVRGLTSNAEHVIGHFQAAALPDQGLILTTGQALPTIVRSPRNYRIVPLADVVADHAGIPHIDIDLIHRILLASPGAAPEQSLPVRFDPYSSTLVLATKSMSPWAIKGKRQVAVVQHLFEQFSKGRRWVPAHEILTSVYGPQKTGRSQRIQNIFSANTIWQDYIANDGNGQYGFNLD